MLIKCLNNAGFDDELTVGKSYEGEFGLWCIKGKHKICDVEFPYIKYENPELLQEIKKGGNK